MGSNEIPKDLTAELEIASMVLSHNDEFLLLACDGLFDVFRSQDAIALARQELIAHRGEPAEVARILSDQTIRVRRSHDNLSILIIVLRFFLTYSLKYQTQLNIIATYILHFLHDRAPSKDMTRKT